MPEPPAPTIRAAPERLVEALNDYDPKFDAFPEDILAAGSAALAAAPEGEGPPAVTISALLHPAYEPGDGSADGAQLVDGEWWNPVMGCDSLQLVVDNARNILSSRWGRPAAPPAPREGEEWRGSLPAEWTPNQLGDDLAAWIDASEPFVDEAGTTYLRDLSGNGRHLRPAAPPAPLEGEVGKAALVRRMCEIILGNTFGNEELDSLALLVGHHPDVLNAPPVPAEGEVGELISVIESCAGFTDESTLVGEAWAKIVALLSQLSAAAPAVGEAGDEEWDALVELAWDKYQTIGYQGERFMYYSDFGNALDMVRKVLARWGRPSAPPAPLEGEVGELVAWLLAYRNEEFGPLSDHPFACSLTRTATLLEQLSAAAPAVVPVVYALTNDELLKLADDSDMDRLEGERGYPDGTVIKEGCWEAWDHQLLAYARDVAELAVLRAAVVPIPVSERPILKSNPFNDAEGRCWRGTAAFADRIGDLTVEHPPSWELRMPQPEDDCVVAAHALPLPAPQSGEVQA